MEKNNIEQREYRFSIRASEGEDGSGIIEGRAIVYGEWTDLGWFDEIIEPGALNKTDLRDVRFLVNHNIDMVPLARSRRNNQNSTMQLIPDQKGMKIRVTLDIENNNEAKALYSAIKRGDITGMSFMFNIDSEEWEDLETEHPKRHITGIGQVLEVSAVTFPAYEGTEIGVRSEGAYSKRTLEDARSALESARSNGQTSEDVNEDELELEKEKAKYLYGI
nr:MAG TPA: prohead serine protease [Caudoviricetes sp.]